MRHRHHLLPIVAAALGIALFAGMDAAMKAVALAIGAYSGMLWRQLFATAFSAPAYLRSRTAWPGRAALRFHVLRGAVGAAMAVLWFHGLSRLPMAEAIALSFVAPLIALYLAAMLLKERVSRQSMWASLLGLSGMLVLLWARLGTGGERHLDGVAAILASAMLYAWNLILMRQQSQVAGPAEVSFFQSLISGAWLLLALPLAMLVDPALPAIPGNNAHWGLIALSAALAVTSLFLLSWAYGREEAQVLVPIEYSAFLWALALGAIFYADPLRWTTLAGAALIVLGCLLAARRPRHVSPVVEVAV
ncbi:DMT family transporter [Sphingomonas sp. KRR8]|uniref:DMT family transporter n=1 Tax=Sphingomonas sp. KRR8 TaxID=2942996 RepID=UPI00202051BD|nr:DMT family transporter [Sphingomonas sp. KRR8]URD60112.1 DMT family transporter [Sphingomonas sp. KRR8]